MPESIRITRFPAWLRSYHKTISRGMRAAASVLPGLAIPVGFYLDDRRVFGEEWTREQFYCDPLTLGSYPLYFLSSLFCADTSFLTSGEINCPVVIVASTGDRLFPFDYVQRIYEHIVALDKEMLILDLDRHLIFNERVEEVLPSMSAKLDEYSTSQEGR
jgi:alpha-beta hydrolase superfamily lysophospholipase